MSVDPVEQRTANGWYIKKGVIGCNSKRNKGLGYISRHAALCAIASAKGVAAYRREATRQYAEIVAEDAKRYRN